MDLEQEKFKVIMSISLLFLTLLTMIDPIGELVHAAPAPTSGYSRGCVDAHIPDHSYRYINQPGLGPIFHSKAFMQAYRNGFEACSHNLNYSTVGPSSFVNWSATAFVQKPFWSPTPLNLSDGFKQFHAILYEINTNNVHPNYGLIQVCLNTNVDTHTFTGHIRNDGLTSHYYRTYRMCSSYQC
jgi:hypothetical protein